MMDRDEYLKAGPSDGPRHRPQSWWRGEKLRTIIFVFGLLVFGYTALKLNPDIARYVSWKVDSDYGASQEHTSSWGSQYLLGVGKADITG